MAGKHKTSAANNGNVVLNTSKKKRKYALQKNEEEKAAYKRTKTQISDIAGELTSADNTALNEHNSKSKRKRKCTEQRSEENKRYYKKKRMCDKSDSDSLKKSADDMLLEQNITPKRKRKSKEQRSEENKRYYKKKKTSEQHKAKNTKLTKSERNRLYYEKNKEKIKASLCKLTKSERNRLYYQKNKEKIKNSRIHAAKTSNSKTRKSKQNKTFYEKNKDKIMQASRKYYRDRVKNSIKHINKKNVDDKSDYERLLADARKAMLEMPGLACTVCHRARFKEQVRVCHRNKYPQTELVRRCFTGKYIHKCSPDCTDTSVYHDRKKKEWICFTCQRHLLKGNMPPQAAINNLWLDDIPNELKSLNALEMHLVLIVQPFMKIVPLPRGGQKGVRGQMVCVPANIQRTADSLPWTLDTNNLIRVKLKRKQQYKGHHLYMVVNQERVMSALKKLMEINPAYKGKSVCGLSF